MNCGHEASHLFEDFTRAFATYFGLEGYVLAPNTRLVEDLAFDSIGVLEAVMWVEAQLGSEVPEDSLDSLVTVGEVFQLLHAAGGSEGLTTH